MRNIKKIWRQHAMAVEAEFTATQRAHDFARLSKAKAQIRKSPLGRLLMDWADSNGVIILFDHDIVDNNGGYLEEAGVVILAGAQDNNELIATLVHELRHAWQEGAGFWPEHFLISPQARMTAVRLKEADATAWQIQVLAELAMAGHRRPWRAMKRDPHFFVPESLSAFIDSVAEDNNNLGNLRAMSAAFHGWFKTNIRKDYDMETLEKYIFNREIQQQDVTEPDDEDQTVGSNVADKIMHLGYDAIREEIISPDPDLKSRRMLCSLTRTLDGGRYFNDAAGASFADTFGEVKFRKNSKLHKLYCKASSLYRKALRANPV